jgi:hypothetical protein
LGIGRWPKQIGRQAQVRRRRGRARYAVDAIMALPITPREAQVKAFLNAARRNCYSGVHAATGGDPAQGFIR